MKKITVDAEKKNTTTESIVTAEEILATNGSLPLPKIISPVTIEKKEMAVSEYIAFCDKSGAVPPWQRENDLWNKAARQYLLHSILLGLPVPPVVFVKRGDKYNCDDGGQRTYSIRTILNDIKNAILVHKTTINDEKATSAAKESSKEEARKLTKILAEFEQAKISVWLVEGASEDVERYIYAALNNGKSHSGGDKGASFIPACASDFLSKAIKICTPINGSHSARLMALYLWAAQLLDEGYCPAGGKAFPIARNISSNENFVAPTEPPFWLESFASAAASRDKGKDAVYSPAFWSKAAAVVMVSHGVRHYTNNLRIRADLTQKTIDDYSKMVAAGKSGKNVEDKRVKAEKATATLASINEALTADNIGLTVAELVRHFDKYDTAAYNVIVGKGTAKNGPVTAKVRACDYMAKSGSGESLSYAKAQLFSHMLEAAFATVQKKEEEEKTDEILDELNAIAEDEGNE